MERKINRRTIKIRAVLSFIAVFVVVTGAVHLINKNQEKQEKLKAVYTAESTIGRVESQLNKYLAESGLIKNIIEDGYDMTSKQFGILSRLMQDENRVIEAHELAKDGIVNEIYPIQGNEEAMGIDMLTNPDRKREAQLAKASGEYTIAGPYELKQGGTGALLFDPIYTVSDVEVSGNTQECTFWGFSILVINWERFLEEIELEKLDEAGYRYQIWKERDNKERVVIAGTREGMSKDVLEVACSVPNDTWYFDIEPDSGWVGLAQKIFGLVITVVLAGFCAIGYWQFETRRYKDMIYAQKIEKSAREARQANEAKTRFLFNMSHDIRTPMNAIIGFSDLLEKHIDEKERVVDYVKKIKSSSAFLLSLINYVLEMARIESGKATLKEEVSDIDELASSMTDVFEPEIEKKGLTYHCDCKVTHAHILSDATKLREIFLNIISNSIKYTPTGGHIEVTIQEISEAVYQSKKDLFGTSIEQPDEKQLEKEKLDTKLSDKESNKKSNKESNKESSKKSSKNQIDALQESSEKEEYAYFEAVVQDTGIGMSEEYLPHIFEEFTREHTSTESQVVGTGLGLPIVKALIELMNGTIHVDSKIGEGTKTTIFLSFRIAKETEIQQKKDEQKVTSYEELKGKRILLAEDNDLNAEIAITILEENGLKVERAVDGVACLMQLKRMPLRYYDAILMDIQMPNMDGCEATRRIRSLQDERSTIPIIAMTANAFDEDRQKVLDAGMNAHVAKPIDIKVLFEVLKENLK